GTTAIPAVREQLGVMAAQAGMIDAMLAGMEAAGAMKDEWYVPHRQYMYSAQVVSQDLYPDLVRRIRELAGGSLIMLPSSIDDFADPELRRIIGRTQRSPSMDPEHRVKFLKLAWDAIGSEFGSRHTQYEMFYAGARFTTAAHSYRTFDWAAAGGMIDDLTSTYELDEMLAADRKHG
ncbi:MAG TPA: 4-hydroxyphenylacetate 3-hydroxylase C-terminal domain-containing protein, partial [Candidatus Limnocylindria bacterium]|nr:4-hydroxyphenylacetate 3-hydroxylase C-terminal domain-containing protein [Candidatus Limnocylindria bacterium]